MCFVGFLGCSRPQIKGSVFVNSNNGDTQKLENAIIIVFSKEKMERYLSEISSTKKSENIFSESDRLGLDQVLRKLGLTSDRIQKTTADDFLKSQKALLDTISRDLSVSHSRTKTDAGGRFELSGVSGDDMIAVFASTSAGGETKLFSWCKTLSDYAYPNAITFNNDNASPNIRTSLAKVFNKMPEISKDLLE